MGAELGVWGIGCAKAWREEGNSTPLIATTSHPAGEAASADECLMSLGKAEPSLENSGK